MSDKRPAEPHGGPFEEEFSEEALEMHAWEIKDLHPFFEDWLSGELPSADEAFRRIHEALAPGVPLIHPSRRVAKPLHRAVGPGGGQARPARLQHKLGFSCRPCA